MTKFMIHASYSGNMYNSYKTGVSGYFAFEYVSNDGRVDIDSIYKYIIKHAVDNGLSKDSLIINNINVVDSWKTK